MIRRCRSVMFRAAVAGGIKCAHAYQPSTSGSATMLVRKNSFWAVIFASGRFRFDSRQVLSAARWTFTQNAVDVTRLKKRARVGPLRLVYILLNRGKLAWFGCLFGTPAVAAAGDVGSFFPRFTQFARNRTGGLCGGAAAKPKTAPLSLVFC